MLELQGLPSDQKEGVEFTAWSIGIDDILVHLNNLEEIICDEDLESHNSTLEIVVQYYVSLEMN